MITIICGTNRAGNNTSIFVDYCFELLKSKTNEEISVLKLEDLPKDFVFNNEVYGGASEELKKVVENKVEKADKFVVISPEYNGGYPGVLKAFIDAVKPPRLYDKKITFIGVSAGRSGNERGMDQLTAVANYLKMHVLPFKPAVSNINGLLEDNVIIDKKTQRMLDKHIEQFVAY